MHLTRNPIQPDKVEKEEPNPFLEFHLISSFLISEMEGIGEWKLTFTIHFLPPPRLEKELEAKMPGSDEPIPRFRVLINPN